MNSQRIAQLRISPLRIQQGLFLLLAMLVTLLAIQQFQHWTQANDTAFVKQPATYNRVSYRAVSAPAAEAGTPGIRAVDGLVSTSEATPQQKWVF